MPFFFICQPEHNYEMFHEDAFDSFNSNIIEADDLDDAILKYHRENVGDEDGESIPDSIESIFAIEVNAKAASYMSASAFIHAESANDKKKAEAERAAKFKQLEELKDELGLNEESIKTLVEIWEHDRFSGPKLDETKQFDTKDEAIAFCEKYNSRNTATHAPEYYTQAKLK